MEPIKVYLEIGKKRTFASALDWPGWCRSGRDEDSALQALFDYGPRYARVLESTPLEFRAPGSPGVFVVVERLEGGAATDFGAPGGIPAHDAQPVDEAGLRRFRALLQACWQAFDEAARAAAGKQLSKGPRGGGRELEAVVQHVQGADGGYLGALGWKLDRRVQEDPDGGLGRTRQTALEALAAAARAEIAPRGPRGGLRWPPRYFVRRVAWHVLDHAWELEDRILRV